MNYANIIVNISHENLDKTFQYRVPDELKSQISVGDYVSIPFGSGNREIKGYVLELTDKAEYDQSKLKYINSIITDSRLVEYKLIQLAYFLKRQYGSTMITALKTVLPIKKNVKEKEEKSIVLRLDDDSALERLAEYTRKHQTARERLLGELIKEKELDYRLVVNKLNISVSTIKAMNEQGVIDVETVRVYRNSIKGKYHTNKAILTDMQATICKQILADYDDGVRDTYLLHGITGSGKTEVYMEIIDEVIKRGKQAIVLIPEIALTYQTVLRFYKRFGNQVSTLHSKLSDGEKYDQFERAKKGEISIMIGPRSALYTPFDNLGLVIIDEEHESSYKSDNMPKYHAREVAIELARLHGASVILGSATPSLESYYKAKHGEYKLYTLTERIGDARLPEVSIVDLKQELKDGNKSVLSRSLKAKMEERLARGEQIMLFLNRRGYSGFVSCRSCGYVFKCPHCDVSLTQHGNGKLVCHYCGYETISKDICPECGSKYIGGMKAGTEQIEKYVKKVFPYATTLRMDADTTKSKDSYENILSAFSNKEADILIGTQMIVKGHDFPYVTLMGILVADMSLNSNDYRASERTFQLLTQAAGRAGRNKLPGEVVIQTYQPDHYSVVCASKQDYEAFYNEELCYRALMDYPPAGHMCAVLFEGSSEEEVRDYSNQLAQMLKNDIIKCLGFESIRMIGPTEASIKKINDVYRYMLYLKSKNMDILVEVKDQMEAYLDAKKKNSIRVTFDMDPLRGY